MTKICIIWLVCITILSNSNAQELTKPEVGKPMPGFTLNNITHYKTKKASLKDFKGKWLFLDFWFTGCVTCIQSFPKVNSFHKEFKNELTWMMVGLNDKKNNKGIEEFYEKARTKQNLEMPIAYDSVLVKQWDIHAMPHIVIADPQGTVRFITDGRDMTAQKLRNLLTGKSAAFFDLTVVAPEKFDPVKAAQSDNDKTIYHSVLEIGNDMDFRGGVEIDRWITWPEENLNEGYNFSGASLGWLYKHAYFGKPVWDFDDPLYGKIYARPILEVIDPSIFSRNSEDGKYTHKYNYSLKLPIARITKENVMKAMQDDLKRIFGYDVSIETRQIPVWKLIAKPGAIEKLKTKGGIEKYASPGTHAMGFEARNWPPYALIGFVCFYVQEKFDNPFIPFIDDTGLNGNFDLALDADMTNIEDIKKELQKQGLDLVKGEKQMKVLVIRDPDASSNR